MEIPTLKNDHSYRLIEDSFHLRTLQQRARIKPRYLSVYTFRRKN